MPKFRAKIPPPAYCAEAIEIEDIFRRLEENGREVDEEFLRRALAYAEQQHGQHEELHWNAFLMRGPARDRSPVLACRREWATPSCSSS